jgi:hypothetical protein
MKTYTVLVRYLKNGHVNLEITMKVNAENEKDAIRLAQIEWRGAEATIIREAHIYIENGKWYLKYDEKQFMCLALKESEYDSDYVKCHVRNFLDDDVKIISDLNEHEKFIHDLRVHQNYFFGFVMNDPEGSSIKDK